MRGLILLPALLLAGACSVKKNMDEMHDRTVQMAETTSDMQRTTETMADTTNDMVMLLAQGDGSRLRDEALRDMVAANNLSSKILYATKYVYAFEFQLWRPDGQDAAARREEYKAEAAIELARTLLLYAGTGSRRNLSATRNNEEAQNLYALVSVLHRINPMQLELVNGTSHRPISMLDILHESLMKASRLNSGTISRDDLAHVDREVLREEQLFTYALQLRSRVLAVIALGRVSRAQDGFLHRAGMRFLRWVPTFNTQPDAATGSARDALNLEQVNYASDILEERQRNVRVLERLGAAIPLERSVRAAWRNMDTRPVRRRLEGASLMASPIASAIERFEALVEQAVESDRN